MPSTPSPRLGLFGRLRRWIRCFRRPKPDKKKTEQPPNIYPLY